MVITIYYHVVEHEELGARLVAAKIEPKRYEMITSAKHCACCSLHHYQMSVESSINSAFV